MRSLCTAVSQKGDSQTASVGSVILPIIQNITASEFDFGKKLTFLFGSQTGTAKAFAYQLSKQAKKKGYDPSVVDLANYKPSALPQDGLVVFIVACFGQWLI